MYFTSSRFHPATKPKRNHPIKASAGKMAKNHGEKNQRKEHPYGCAMKLAQLQSHLGKEDEQRGNPPEDGKRQGPFAHSDMPEPHIGNHRKRHDAHDIQYRSKYLFYNLIHIPIIIDSSIWFITDCNILLQRYCKTETLQNKSPFFYPSSQIIPFIQQVNNPPSFVLTFFC